MLYELRFNRFSSEAAASSLSACIYLFIHISMLYFQSQEQKDLENVWDLLTYYQYCRCSGVFFLTSNRFHTWFWCFIVLVIHSWLWTSKCQLGSYRDIPKTGFKGFSWKFKNSFKVRLNFILTLSTTNLHSYPLSSDFKMCWFQIQRWS